MFKGGVLLLSLLFVCCLGANSLDTVEDMLSKMTILETKVEELTRRLADRTDGEILFFRDREDCPDGYLPMENAEGRLLMLGGSRRGKVSGHTMFDRRTLSLPCSSIIEVAESGMMKVCNLNAGNSTHFEVDLEALIPHVYMKGCFRPGASSPVVP